MKKRRWLFALILLILASLACQTLTGGGATPTVVVPTLQPVDNTNLNDNSNPDTNTNTNDSTSSGSDTSTAGFPLPPDAQSVTDLGPDLVTFETNMDMKEVMDYYREVLGDQGYTERADLTVTDNATYFSMVFDGHESGKALAIQGVNFGGSVTVTLTLQDL
ncbi:MAG: hypothetical protein AB1649_33350 [Chloroflexota bacterium]